ncbi:hypothetical protein PIROE2DRAFT_18629 [Piromyces sp. E2]|nr:hypothetical protein PIROE2DRAFT_18629 [Piromyces sp. E2]|eukprot:OUM56654.1 hypothetical protein PIROE2DRAFT_18629 [Piromyces sp. E2]
MKLFNYSMVLLVFIANMVMGRVIEKRYSDYTCIEEGSRRDNCMEFWAGKWACPYGKDYRIRMKKVACKACKEDVCKAFRNNYNGGNGKDTKGYDECKAKYKKLFVKEYGETPKEHRSKCKST